MRVREIPRDKLREIHAAEWIDRTRSPFAEGDIAWVPVKPGEPFDRELSKSPRYTGRGFVMIGDIAVLHGTKPSGPEIEEMVRFRKPRGILWIAALSGMTRTPETEVLWGEAGEVRHRENGYTFILDPRTVMFAQGNRNEKMRLARLVRSKPGTERVADMFAGIGYFSIPLAGAGAEVHAMEINPVPFEFLKRTIRENGLSDRITPALGDCRDLLSGTYNRIVMGHFDAITLLPPALGHVESGSIIHLHSIGTVEDRIRECAEGAGFSATIQVHKVKKYRPYAWHVVQDVTLS